MRSGPVHGRRALMIVGGVFLAVGAAGLAAAGGLSLKERMSGRNVHAQGTIVGFDYGPVVAFTTEQGQTLQFVSPVRTTAWRRGEHPPVVYNPAGPEDAAIDGFTGRWFLPTLFGLLGGTFFLIGSLLGLLAWRISTSANALGTPG